MTESPVTVHFAPARAAVVYTVEIEGEAVLLDDSTARLHLLNQSAALVWALIDGEATVAELASELATALGLAEATALADVLAIVGQLHDEGLV